MRPLWMEYPDDILTFGIDINYMFGDSFLLGATYPRID
jgi:alpha-glucosidase (family GH31 glycosyl hydrolase)